MTAPTGVDDLAPYDFVLPPGRIAYSPARPRDAARLLYVGATLADRRVLDLPTLLAPGDLLVVNDTRVIPAQLEARRGNARIGLTLDRPAPNNAQVWHALARNARRLRPGDVLTFADGSAGAVLARDGDSVVIRFDDPAVIDRVGALALPPYIDRPTGPTEADRADYQTEFAAMPGAVAAPTAGLHFTSSLLDALVARGVGLARVTLHVGAGTFLPVRDNLATHRMHPERGTVPTEAATAINAARAAGGRIVCVGTTSLRLLETAADPSGTVRAWSGETSLFIRPGHVFRTADRLLTNFHLPRSTLFVLVCAFAGTTRMRAAYAHAIAEHYRFYSYGDATLLERTS